MEPVPNPPHWHGRLSDASVCPGFMAMAGDPVEFTAKRLYRTAQGFSPGSAKELNRPESGGRGVCSGGCVLTTSAR